MKPTKIVRRALRRLGYDLHRLPAPNLTLRDLEFDLPFLVPPGSAAVLDIGANKGQTIDILQRTLGRRAIHSFEPNPSLANFLRGKYEASGVKVANSAMGSSVGEIDFSLTDNDELNSVLELKRSAANPFSETKTCSRIKVPVSTVDHYCEQNLIERVGLLKSDTQGYDFEVLKGAASMLKSRRVEVILVEVNFITLYENQCDFGQIERWLAGLDYRLLAFYEVIRTGRAMNWATACFGLQPKSLK